MKRWLVRLLVLALLVAAVVAVRATVFAPEPVPVTVFTTELGRVEETVTNSKAGTVRSRRRAKLSPELAGRVAALPVTEGDRVEPGQLLLRIADEEHRANFELRSRAVDVARASRRQACLAASLAERELVRHARLGEQEVVSDELVDQLRSKRDETQAACAAARAAEQEMSAALEVARVALTRTELRAPFDGVVAEVAVEIGEWITPSPPGVYLPAVIEVLDPTAIYVSAPIDEVDVGKVTVGQEVRVTLDAFPGQSFAGQVHRVAPYVLDLEGQNRTFEIEVELADADFARRLLPGTSADVEVVLSAHDDVLRIPSYALMEGSKVLVLDAGLLREVTVETDLRNWQFAEVTSGLEKGDEVVVSLDRVEVKAGAEAVADDRDAP